MMWLRVWSLMKRYLYLYRRSLARAGEIFFWPVMDLLVWGFVTKYVEQQVDVPGAVLFFIGAMIFWDVLYRSQQAITIAIMEDIWVRNILNVFVAPVSLFEFTLATCLVGVLKISVITMVLGVIAFFGYQFNLLTVGPLLIPFLACLMLFGWSVGMVTMGIILRFGQAAEALVWGVPFLLQPVSAVFYPVDVLPPWLQYVAWSLPSTYVFEGLRAVLKTGTLDGRLLAAAIGLNVLYVIAGAAIFAWLFNRCRREGNLSRVGLQ